MSSTSLVIKQLDRQLGLWQKTLHWFTPKEGWVRTVRKALGMTTQQLAIRMDVNRSRLLKIEQAEQEDAITLRTLREAAKALQCELVYAFVPKEPLSNILESQAKKIAKKRIERVSHTMRLENQSTNQHYQKEQYEALVKTLLTGHPKHLWEDND